MVSSFARVSAVSFRARGDEARNTPTPASSPLPPFHIEHHQRVAIPETSLSSSRCRIARMQTGTVAMDAPQQRYRIPILTCPVRSRTVRSSDLTNGVFQLAIVRGDRSLTVFKRLWGKGANACSRHHHRRTCVAIALASRPRTVRAFFRHSDFREDESTSVMMGRSTAAEDGSRWRLLLFSGKLML